MRLYSKLPRCANFEAGTILLVPGLPDDDLQKNLRGDRRMYYRLEEWKHHVELHRARMLA
ncbi:MAG: hypothetical protein CL912_27625 [Deltaproteobacteria bacterium]|nr:hypothetical protein [Deltaproteobacteria bacterium]